MSLEDELWADRSRAELAHGRGAWDVADVMAVLAQQTDTPETRYNESMTTAPSDAKAFEAAEAEVARLTKDLVRMSEEGLKVAIKERWPEAIGYELGAETDDGNTWLYLAGVYTPECFIVLSDLPDEESEAIREETERFVHWIAESHAGDDLRWGVDVQW